MSTIHEVVHQSLQRSGRSQYADYAAPVVTDLVNREHQIVGQLIQFGTQQGLSENAVREALTNCGMEVPAVRAVPETTMAEPMTDSDDPVVRMLTDIQNQLSGLTQFARDNGYSG